MPIPHKFKKINPENNPKEINPEKIEESPKEKTNYNSFLELVSIEYSSIFTEGLQTYLKLQEQQDEIKSEDKLPDNVYAPFVSSDLDLDLFKGLKENLNKHLNEKCKFENNSTYSDLVSVINAALEVAPALKGYKIEQNQDIVKKEELLKAYFAVLLFRHVDIK